MSDNALFACAIACAIAIGVVVMVGTIWLAIESRSSDHDPVKMLQLRTDCLEKDRTSKYTTYCDDYAERYSRIPAKP